VQLCFKNCKIITPKTIFQRLNDIVFNNNTIYHNNFTNNFRPQILHENIMLINKDEVERSELC
jgi:hypothetical protein